MSDCDPEAFTLRRAWPTRSCCAWKKQHNGNRTALSVGTVTRLLNGRQKKFDFRSGPDIFLSNVSKPALQPKQDPMQRILGVLFPRVKQPEKEVQHLDLYNSSYVKNYRRYIGTLVCPFRERCLIKHRKKVPIIIFSIIGPISILRPPLWSSGQSFWLQIQKSRVRSPALPDFLSSSGSGTGSTQPRGPREVN